uniref:Peptidase S1 domain-containing protein n=1 Tax=Clytia hemisphaerica TaxID=252671 RepID=A0A7M5WXS8_9CNID
MREIQVLLLFNLCIASYGQVPVGPVVRNRLYKNIGKIHKSYSFTFEMKPTGTIAGWSNIVHAYDKEGNCCGVGQRIPAIFMSSNSTRLRIANAVSINGNYGVNRNIPMGQFTNVTIQQVEQSGGSYLYSIYLNTTKIASTVNTQPQEFDNVQLFASDKWYNPSKVVLRYFNFQSPFSKYDPTKDNNELAEEICKGRCIDLKDKCGIMLGCGDVQFDVSKHCPETCETYLLVVPVVWDRLYKNIGKIHKSYSFTFEMKPTGTIAGWSNIVHAYDKEGNCCQVGQRIPAIFMASSSTRLHITNAVSGKGNYAVNRNIPMGQFTNVTIQQVEQSDGSYLYSIYLNTTKIASTVNTQPQEFDNVQLFASDKWYNPSKVVLGYFNFQSPYPKQVPADSECGVSKVGQSRIVGGQNALPGEWPWQVFYIIRKGTRAFSCGGVLIHKKWVLTAAHCTVGDGAFVSKLYLGEHERGKVDAGEQTPKVKRIINHEMYRLAPGTNSFDFALLELETEAQITDNVRTICIPKKRSGTDFDNQICDITGWGTTSESGRGAKILQEASVRVYPQRECLGNYGSRIGDSMFCAGYRDGGVDSCQGDSGGPLQCKDGNKWVLWGITSWGFGCARPGRAGVYGKVTQVVDWIEEKTGVTF